MMKIPMKAVPKARPRGKGKQFYMPKDYMAAKEEFAELLKNLRVPTNDFSGAVSLEVVFGSDAMWVQIVPVAVLKPKGMRRSDLDNLVGFVMDALQDADVIKNDSQVVSIAADYKQEDL